MNGLSAMNHSLPECLDVVASQTFQISVGHNGGRVIAYHTATMTRTGPLGQETTLKVSIYQTFLHFDVHRGIDEIQEWEQTTERIPETGIRKHIAFLDFTIIRTIVDNLALSIHLVKTAWKEYRTIQTAIECA